MEFNFLDRIMVKSKLRRTETYIPQGNNKKQWEINRFKHPREGVVIGWRTISNGELVWSSDEPPTYQVKDHFRVLLVVIDERLNPIYVLPKEAYER